MTDTPHVDAPRQTDERIVPELTEELLRTLPTPIAAAIHQLKISRDGQRRRAEAAEQRQEELRAELAALRDDFRVTMAAVQAEREGEANRG